MTRRAADWVSGHTFLVVVILYGIALGLRLYQYSHLTNTLMAHVLLMDEAYYRSEAQNILLGVPQPTDSWFMTPLYPYFLSAIFLVRDAPVAAYLVQMILGAALAPLAFVLARRLMGPLWGVVAGLAVATFAPLVFFEGLLLVESLVTVSLTASFVLAVGGRQAPARAAVSGLLLGIAILGRGSNAVLLPVWLLWFWFAERSSAAGSAERPAPASIPRWKRAWKPAWLWCAAGCLVTLLPLLAYNATHARQPLFLTANGGFNLYLGNGPQATGIFQLPEDLDLAQDPLALRYVQRNIQRPVTASEAQHFWMQKTLEHVREHPGRAVQLVAWKLLLFWNRTSFPQVEGFETAIETLPLSRWPFWRSLLVLPLALLAVGIVILDRRHPEAAARRFLVASVLLYSAAIALFFITDRYRMGILPLVIVLALLPFEAAVRAWTRHRRWMVLPMAVALALLVHLTDSHRLAIDRTRMRRDIHVHDALRFAKAERYEAAVDEYRQALQLDPDDPEILDGLARLYARAGLDSLALDQLEGLLRDHPESARSWYNLGNLYRRLQRHEDAIDAFERSLALEPQREAAWNNLGESYRALGDTLRAEQAYRRALDLVPGHEQAWNNLGALLALRGDVAAAEDAFRSAIRSNPRYVPGWTNLAILLTNAGRYEEALDAWRMILRIEPRNPLARDTVRRIEEAREGSS